MSCMFDPRWNTASNSASSSKRPVTQANAVYSPTECPQAIAPSTNAPRSRISATCAAATVAIATWVNCVR